jgi:hypothetical protein
MKSYFLACLLLLPWLGWSQQSVDQAGVEAYLEAFLGALGAKDTAQLRELMAPELVLRTIGPIGETRRDAVLTTPVDRFLVELAQADVRELEEKIDHLRVEIDGPLAHAWMDYQFYLDGDLHHCGVNSFTLFHDGQGWRVIHLIDTRRQDCK